MMLTERKGGAITFHLGPGMDSPGVVAAWEPPRRFAYEESDWHPGAPPLATEFLQVLRLYVTYFPGQRCSTILVTGNAPAPEDRAWAALTAALGLSGAAVGERRAATPSPARRRSPASSSGRTAASSCSAPPSRRPPRRRGELRDRRDGLTASRKPRNLSRASTVNPSETMEYGRRV